MQIKKWQLPTFEIFWEDYDRHYKETNGESYTKEFRINQILLCIDIITSSYDDSIICYASLKHIGSKKYLDKKVDFLSRLDGTDRFNWYVLMKNWAAETLEKYIMGYFEKE